MTTEQIKNTELTSQDIVSRNMPVFAKEVPLALAKDIQGLRAIFEEVSIISYNLVQCFRENHHGFWTAEEKSRSRTFPCLVPATCSYLEIWLVHLMVCTHCDWLFQLLLVSRFTLTQSAYFLLAPHLMTYKKIHRPDINTLWSFVAERKQQFHFSIFSFCFLSPLPKSTPNRQQNKVVCLANELLFR